MGSNDCGFDSGDEITWILTSSSNNSPGILCPLYVFCLVDVRFYKIIYIELYTFLTVI